MVVQSIRVIHACLSVSVRDSMPPRRALSARTSTKRTITLITRTTRPGHLMWKCEELERLDHTSITRGMNTMVSTVRTMGILTKRMTRPSHPRTSLHVVSCMRARHTKTTARRAGILRSKTQDFNHSRPLFNVVPRFSRKACLLWPFQCNWLDQPSDGTDFLTTHDKTTRLPAGLSPIRFGETPGAVLAPAKHARLLKGGLRFLRSPEFSEDYPCAIVSHGIPGSKLDHLLKSGQGLLWLPEVSERGTFVQIGSSISGSQHDRLLRGDERLRWSFEIQECKAFAQVGINPGGIELDRLFKRGQGLCQSSKIQERLPFAIVSVGIPGSKPDHLFIGSQRFLGPPEVSEENAFVQMGKRGSRVKHVCLLKGSQRLSDSSEFLEHKHFVHVGVGISGSELDHL